MKIRHVKSSIMPKILKVDAITLYPFILYRSEEPSETLIRHELVHVEQIERIGVFRFYTSYLLEYLSYRIAGDSKTTAYNKISYEKEAYAKEEL